MMLTYAACAMAYGKYHIHPGLLAFQGAYRAKFEPEKQAQLQIIFSRPVPIIPARYLVWYCTLMVLIKRPSFDPNGVHAGWFVSHKHAFIGV
jgi:hypothetical protein